MSGASDLHTVVFPDRGLVQIAGPDRMDFAQRLFTNDFNVLKNQDGLYACLLTPQGKYLHDVFAVERNETLLLECEGGARAQDLARRLDLYRLRTNVRISCISRILSGAFVTGTDPFDVRSCSEMEDYVQKIESSGGILFPDPRNPYLGWRFFFPQTDNDLSQEKEDFTTFKYWDRRRIALAIPDGSRDMVPEQSHPIENNIDKVHGISFEKGCYVGQELVARVHHRGLVKKRLCALRTTGTFPAFGEDIRLHDGTLAGEMRSSCDDLGLALIRTEALPTLEQEKKFNLIKIN